jgi:hypothetical protein
MVCAAVPNLELRLDMTQNTNGNTPTYIKSLLAPNKSTRGSRRAWGIDVEAVWVPFFTATNVMGETFLPVDVLGAPIRLAKTKDGEVRFDNNGRPRMSVHQELNAQVTLVRENFVAGLQAYTGSVMEERTDAYREQVEAQQLAGAVVLEQLHEDVAQALELLAEAEAALEAAAAAQVEQEAAESEPETKTATRRSRASTPTPAPESAESLAS